MEKGLWIIDRFEGEYAVCENLNGIKCNIQKNMLPKGCIEGSCIEVLEDDTIIRNLEEEEKRRNLIQDLMKQLF